MVGKYNTSERDGGDIYEDILGRTVPANYRYDEWDDFTLHRKVGGFRRSATVKFVGLRCRSLSYTQLPGDLLGGPNLVQFCGYSRK